MILNAIAEKLKRQSKDDFRGRHFEAWLIVQAVTWYLRYPLGVVTLSFSGWKCQRLVDIQATQAAIFHASKASSRW